MANFFKILTSKKTKSDCCNIEIKEIPKNAEQNEECCGGDPTCC
jgi:hypothetical protein